MSENETDEASPIAESIGALGKAAGLWKAWLRRHLKHPASDHSMEGAHHGEDSDER